MKFSVITLFYFTVVNALFSISQAQDLRYNFLQLLDSNELLNRVFTTPLSPLELSNGIYSAVYNTAVKFGAPNPSIVANVILSTLGPNLSTLQPTTFVSALSNFAESILSRQGILTPTSAATLSNALVDSLENAIRAGGSLNDPSSYIQGVIEGSMNFLNNYGINFMDIYPALVSDYATHLSSSAVPGLLDFSSDLFPVLASNDLLTRVFTTELAPPDLSNAIYSAVFNTATNFGAPNPMSLANVIANAVGPNLSNVKPAMFVSALSKFVENALSQRGILTPANSATISSSLNNSLEDAIRASGSLDNPASYIQGVIEGSMNFLNKYGINFLDIYPELVSDYATQLSSFII